MWQNHFAAISLAIVAVASGDVRMRWRRWLQAELVLLLVGGQASAQDVSQPVPGQTVNSPVVFAPLDASAFPPTVKMTNGKPVKDDEWRTMMNAKVGEYRLPNGELHDRTCTASLVGVGVMLTAAHCLDFKELTAATPIVKASFEVRPNVPVALTCLLPTEYLVGTWAGRTPRNAHDFALCTFPMPDKPPPRLKDLRYEVLNLTKTMAANDPVLMTGFGCKTLFVGPDGLDGADFDGAFTIADSRITRDAAYGFLEIVSSLMKQAALCPGDSGGPVMIDVDVAKPAGPRRIVAVNSSIAAEPASVDGAYDVRSSFAPLNTAVFAAYRARWQASNKTFSICDLSNEGYPCRKK